MVRVRDLDMSLKKKYKKMKIKDINNNCYRVDDLKSFTDHIETYHSHGISIHEENGYFFRVDDNFRKQLNKIKK